jgi:hypothetical protein
MGRPKKTTIAPEPVADAPETLTPAIEETFEPEPDDTVERVIAVEPEFQPAHVTYLEDFAIWANQEAEAVEQAINPTNVFALRYRKLAQDATDMISLIKERGHTGVPHA